VDAVGWDLDPEELRGAIRLLAAMERAGWDPKNGSFFFSRGHDGPRRVGWTDVGSSVGYEMGVIGREK
jgi:hypothetical protein